MDKVQIESALAASQTEFLTLLRQFTPKSLHRQHRDEPWTPAVILLHMCEARTHYTSDINLLVESDYAATVGRSTDDPGRLEVIAQAAAGNINAEEIEEQLRLSFRGMMRAVARVKNEDMNRPVQVARADLPAMTTATFMARFLVGHHRMHTRQLAALN